MSEPNIPSVPSSLPPDQAQFFGAMKSAIELLMGQGRTSESDRAARYGELASINTSLDYVIESVVTPSGDTPDPPTDLIVEKGMWVHFLSWTNPEDTVVSHIEVWVSKNTQSRSAAAPVSIITVTDALRGETGKYTATLDDATADYTYWIRSVSYAGNVSTWEPPDVQGGYVVPGEDTIGEIIDNILEALTGNITEDHLYIDLSSRLNLIDALGTGLVDRMVDVRGIIGNVDAYNDSTLYIVDDTAKYNDFIYICTLDVESIPAPLPTNTAYWDLIGEYSSSLTGNMNTNTTAIATLDAGINEEGGYASRTTALEVTVDDETTGVDATATAFSDLYIEIHDTGGFVSRIEELELTVDDPILGGTISALALSALKVVVDDPDDGVTANAGAIEQLSTTVGDRTASVETIAESIDGIEGKYTVKIDNNGYVSGFGLISTANDGTPTSEFIILADTFKVVTPGKTPQVPFVVGSVDGVSTVGINGNLVVDSTILARHIQAGSITADRLDSTDIFALKITVGAGSSGIGNLSDAGDLAAKNRSELDFVDGADKTSNVVSAMAYESMVSKAKLDSTILSGGFIRTSLLQTDVLLVGAGLSNLDSAASSKLGGIASGADKTSSNTAYDTSRVNGASASTVKTNAANGATFTSSSYLDYGKVNGTKPPSDADKTSSNTAGGLVSGADISAAKAYGKTLISGGYLNTDILMVDTGQIKNLAVDTLQIKDGAVTDVTVVEISVAISVASTGETTVISASLTVIASEELLLWSACENDNGIPLHGNSVPITYKLYNGTTYIKNLFGFEKYTAPSTGTLTLTVKATCSMTQAETLGIVQKYVFGMLVIKK